KDFEITHQLDQTKVPALITYGEYDEAGYYYVQKPIHDAIKGFGFVIFKNSEHMMTWEVKSIIVSPGWFNQNLYSGGISWKTVEMSRLNLLIRTLAERYKSVAPTSMATTNP